MPKSIAPASARLLLIALGLVSTACTATGKPPATPAASPPEALEAGLPQWMAQAHVPGVAIARIEHGRLAWTAVEGERAPGEPMRPDTVFNVASLTKPVFALMTLHLVADDRYALDTPLSKDWVDPDVAGDPRLEALTARLALSHQSGFQNWRGDDRLAFSFAPGERHEYSGEGYEYLRRAIERRTGERLPQLMRDTVLDHVAMPHTHFGWDAGVGDNLAVGYRASGQPYADMSYLRAREPGAAASLLTTVEDYGRFAAWVSRGADLPKALFEDMQQPQARHANPAERFGLGWRLVDVGGHTVLSHDGRENGVRTQVFVSPDDGEGLVILTSSDNGDLLTRPIVAATLAQGDALLAAADADVWTYLQRMPAAAMPHVAHAVIASPSFMSRLLHAVDVALIQPSSLTAEEKRAAAAAIRPFVLAMLDGQVSEDQAKAVVERLAVQDGGGMRWRDAFTPEQARAWIAGLAARDANAGKDVEVPSARLDAYAGHYRVPSSGLQIRVRHAADGLEATADGMPVVKLHARSQDLFSMQEDATRFQFVSDTTGRVTGLRVIWSATRSELAPREE